MDTPELEIAYAPQDFSAFRENGESWKGHHARHAGAHEV